MSKNPHQNRLEIQQADKKGALGVALRQLTSLGKALFTERTCAKPKYDTWQRLGMTAADALTGGMVNPPDQEAWNFEGYWGLHGYLEFNGGTAPEADLELWAYAPGRDEWFLVETKSSVGRFQEFHFDGKVRHRKVFVRVASLTLDGAVDVDLIATPE